MSKNSLKIVTIFGSSNDSLFLLFVGYYSGIFLILFITDSIHQNIPAQRLSGNTQCIKRINWELHNIDKFEHIFKDSEVVFISCGINDLSRYSDKFNAINLIALLLKGPSIKDVCSRGGGGSGKSGC